MAKRIVRTGYTFLFIASFAVLMVGFARPCPAVEGRADAFSVQAAAPAGEMALDCQQLAEQLQQQKNLIAREAGQVKREIAALREEIGKPGIKEVFAGIGYIFGLAGVGMYMSSRRRS